MAKLIYVCVRNQADIPLVKKKVEFITRRLVPDNIPGAECRFAEQGNIIYGISVYSKIIAEKDGSVCMGVAYRGNNQWWQPHIPPPDGTYAIFRCNNDFVELLTDITGTRSVWYYKDESIFIAGTSQRAVIALAGEFEFNKKVLPWILSSGSLGHYNSWSKNVQAVQANGSVTLNRNTWKLATTVDHVKYTISERNDEDAFIQFKQTIFDSFNSINTDFSQWILPLSGGYDSRAIACILKATGKDISQLDTITWGTRASQFEKETDGYVGGAVAKSLGLNHSFCETDDIKESTAKIFERFIHCSEGRIDHIPGYTDGLAIWRNIFYSGKQGIIRGDETLGAPLVNGHLRARMITELKYCSDFSNLEDYEKYGFEKQEIPEAYLPLAGETPGTLRERLYQNFRLPNIMAALSDIKFCYTEILNPFLSRAIVSYSRTMPDYHRADRLLFKKMLDEISPKVKYASAKSTAQYSDILTNPEAVELMSNELSEEYMKEIFPEEYINKILGKIQHITKLQQESFVDKSKASIQRKMPGLLKEILRKNLPKPSLDNYRIAFRMYMTGKVYKMINEDIKLINELPVNDQASASIS